MPQALGEWGSLGKPGILFGFFALGPQGQILLTSATITVSTIKVNPVDLRAGSACIYRGHPYCLFRYVGLSTRANGEAVLQLIDLTVLTFPTITKRTTAPICMVLAFCVRISKPDRR
jgi:hypothetical protein